MNNPVVTDEMVLTANLEVDRLEKELDITNADHIALWLASAGKMPISFLACRIADAYDRARDGELERLRAALREIFEMWAGSEGFIPHTAPEGYLLELIKKMADRAALAKMEESK